MANGKWRTVDFVRRQMHCRSELPRTGDRQVVGVEAVLGAEVVEPLSQNRQPTATRLGNPDEARAGAEGVGLEITEERAGAAVARELLIVVAPDAEREARRK